MDSIIENLLVSLLTGGPTVIVAVLVIAIIGLLIDRHRLIKEVAKKEEKIDSIIDDYYRGNMTLSEALNSLKLVLYEIKGKL